jgi:hypothetical protein
MLNSAIDNRHSPGAENDLVAPPPRSLSCVSLSTVHPRSPETPGRVRRICLDSLLVINIISFRPVVQSVTCRRPRQQWSRLDIATDLSFRCGIRYPCLPGSGCADRIDYFPTVNHPHDLGLSESQHQIASRRVLQLVGGPASGRIGGALGNGGGRKPAKRIWGRRCTRARVCRHCPS